MSETFRQASRGDYSAVGLERHAAALRGVITKMKKAKP